MKKLVIATLLAGMFGIAHADGYNYVTGTFDAKDKVGSTNNHNVYGINFGRDFGNTWKVEARMEDETVNGGAHEGLIQLKVNKDIGTWYGITPYAGVAVGEKDKSTTNFLYYLGEIGAKYKVNDQISVWGQGRLRTPFNEGLDLHTGYGYKTWENSIGVKYTIDNNNAVGIKYAVERGDSQYDTVGVNYTYSFK